MERLAVTDAALAGLRTAARDAALGIDPDAVARPVAEAVASLGALASAAALADLGRHLGAVLVAVQARWWDIAAAADAAAARYAEVDAGHGGA